MDVLRNVGLFESGLKEHVSAAECSRTPRTLCALKLPRRLPSVCSSARQ
jgi:hypothetical protein